MTNDNQGKPTMKGNVMKNAQKNETRNLTIDEELCVETLQMYRENNPQIKRETLDDFGARTGTIKLREKESDEINEWPCLAIPLYGKTGNIVNHIIILADRALTNQSRYYFGNKKYYGIMCVHALREYIKCGTGQFEHVMFCDKPLDAILFSGTIDKESRNSIAVFTLFAPDGNICDDGDFPNDGTEDWHGSFQGDSLIYTLLELLKQDNVRLLIFDQGNPTTRRTDRMVYMSSGVYSIKFPSLKLPPAFSGDSVEKYICSGGTLDGLIATYEINSIGYQPEPLYVNPYEVELRKGNTFASSWEISTKQPLAQSGTEAVKALGKSILRKHKIKCYHCADEGTLLHQLSPEKGTVTFIAGPPGVGKTAFAMQVIAEMIKRNANIHNVLVANTDQSTTDLMRREACRECNIPLGEIRDNLIFANSVNQRSLRESFAKVTSVAEKCHFIADPPIYIEDIENDVEALKPEILLVDHLHEIKIDERPKIKDNDRISYLTTVLRGFACRGVAVIALLALNRTGAKSAKYGSLDFSALRGSSSLEYSATKIWFLRNALKKSGYTHILEGAKSKETLLTDVPLNFDGSRMQFSVAEPTMEPKPEPKSPMPRKANSAKKAGKMDTDGGTFAE